MVMETTSWSMSTRQYYWLEGATKITNVRKHGNEKTFCGLISDHHHVSWNVLNEMFCYVSGWCFCTLTCHLRRCLDASCCCPRRPGWRALCWGTGTCRCWSSLLWILHMATAISTEDHSSRSWEHLSEMPKSWVTFHFTLKNSYYQSATQCTGKLEIKCMVQACQLSHDHVDTHYVVALFWYLK